MDICTALQPSQVCITFTPICSFLGSFLATTTASSRQMKHRILMIDRWVPTIFKNGNESGTLGHNITCYVTPRNM